MRLRLRNEDQAEDGDKAKDEAGDEAKDEAGDEVEDVEMACASLTYSSKQKCWGFREFMCQYLIWTSLNPNYVNSCYFLDLFRMLYTNVEVCVNFLSVQPNFEIIGIQIANGPQLLPQLQPRPRPWFLPSPWPCLWRRRRRRPRPEPKLGLGSRLRPRTKHCAMPKPKPWPWSGPRPWLWPWPRPQSLDNQIYMILDVLETPYSILRFSRIPYVPSPNSICT